MKTRKWIVYGVFFLALICVWLVYTDQVLRSAEETSRQMLRQEIAAAQGQLEAAFSQYAQMLRTAFEVVGQGDDQAIYDLLNRLQSRFPSCTFYATLQNGLIVDRDGAPINFQVGYEKLQMMWRNGYVLFAAGTSGEETIALMTPIAGNNARVAILSMPVQAYGGVLLDALSFPARSMMLYDATGTPVAPLTANAGQATYADVQAQQFGAMDFAGQKEIHIANVQGARQTYEMFVPLEQPTGWFLGGRTTLDGGMYSTVTRATVICTILLVLVLAMNVCIDMIYESHKRHSLHEAQYKDPLTGLWNNAGMARAVERFLAENTATEYSFVCLDIRAFHRFNTMFGHRTGDTLLSIIGNIIEQDHACGTRSGGDIFAFIAKSSPDIAQRMTERLETAVAEGLGEHYNQMIEYKFGVYPVFSARTSFREMHDGAMLALKVAKDAPKRQEVIYDLSLQRDVKQQEAIEINMLHALSKDEFKVYIQPQFSASTEAACGAEALVRWHSEEMGLLMPDRFIPLFEKNGFIVELDFYMLATVLDAMQRALDAGQHIYPISVNQSRLTITFPNYLQRLTALVQQYTVPRHYLHLEVTESVIGMDKEGIIRLLERVKALGFTLALDDFGAGFSSLNALRDLPVDIIKIDRAFLDEGDAKAKNQLIIKNIIAMSKDLQMDVICEGVETREQLLFLRHIGCDMVQGFLLAKPMPYADYERRFLGPINAWSPMRRSPGGQDTPLLES